MTLLFLGFCCLERPHSLEMTLRVDEFLDRLDLQVPVVVGDDVSDHYRFAEHVDSNQGSHRCGVL